MAAYDELIDKVLPFVREDGIDFERVRLRGICAEQYAVYQAVKTIVTGSGGITIDDLAYPELVRGEAFRLIVTALLLARCGEAVFSLESRFARSIFAQDKEPPWCAPAGHPQSPAIRVFFEVCKPQSA